MKVAAAGRLIGIDIPASDSLHRQSSHALRRITQMPGFRKWLMRWLIPDDVLALPVSRQDGFPVLLIDHMPQHAIFSAEHQAALDRWLGEVQGMPARTAIPDAATHLLVSARNGTVISVVMGVDMSAA